MDDIIDLFEIKDLVTLKNNYFFIFFIPVGYCKMATSAKSIIDPEMKSILGLMTSHIFKEMFQECWQSVPEMLTGGIFWEYDLETFPVFH